MSRIARSKPLARAQPFQGLGPALGVARDHAPFAGLQGEDSAVGRVVVHDQQAQIGQLRLRPLERGRRRVGHGLQGEREMERGSFLRHTLDPHLAAHQLDQPFADGQTKAGAAVVARRRSVRLAEGLEQAGQPVHGDPNAGVAHQEMKLPGFRLLAGSFRRGKDFHLDDDFTRGGELDSVADQVDEHLPQPGHIAAHLRRNAIVHLVGEVQLLLRRLRRQQVKRVFNARAQVKRLVLQFELAGLDLREVEDVVDDGEQGFAAGIDRLHVAVLLVGQRGFQQQAGHGDDAVHRRADFVAHVGQEFRFGARGAFGGDARGQQLAVGLGQFVLQMFGAQHRSQTRPQFGGLKGLGQVINRSQLEPPQLVGRAVPGGQDDDGDGLRLRGLLELPQQLEPVDARQSQVEQDQIELLLARQLQPLGRILGAGEGDVVILQETRQDLRHSGIIFDQQDLGRRQIHSPAFSIIVVCAG